MFGPTDVILIMGRRGCGKSYLCRQIQALYPRVVRFDSLGEYPEDEGTCRSFSEFGKKILATEGRKRFTLTYRFSNFPGSQREEFDEALCVLWHRGDVLVVIEEVQNFSKPHSMPWWLEQCLTTGRHQRVAVVATSQMPRFIPKALISQANHVFSGTLHEKYDLDYAGSIFDDELPRLRVLPERRFLYFSLGSPVVEVGNSLR